MHSQNAQRRFFAIIVRIVVFIVVAFIIVASIVAAVIVVVIIGAAFLVVASTAIASRFTARVCGERGRFALLFTLPVACSLCTRSRARIVAIPCDNARAQRSTERFLAERAAGRRSCPCGTNVRPRCP